MQNLAHLIDTKPKRCLEDFCRDNLAISALGHLEMSATHIPTGDQGLSFAGKSGFHGCIIPWILLVHIIPVLDIKDGLVVRAHMGNRAAYRPIETPLSPTADILDVAQGLRQLYPFPAFYVAELDAIQQGLAPGTLERLKPLVAVADVWLDAGFASLHQLEGVLTMDGVWPVLGSESQTDTAVLGHLSGNPRLVLSLDFRGDEFLGPSELFENADLWPSRVIVMTLRRVGSNSGPDFERLTEIKRRAGDRAVIAAGGIRHAADLEQLEALGISAALVATSLHNGSLAPETISSLMSGNESGTG
ncbi:HisA/HisF-related TIM barrel protein [Phyllobacterium myrsinacearum]|uniref:HisA/HisF-related TIM barrel protein n=1 Tax=Phyllobacterium myrsinacearum TaxID=28101 RepID=UPI001FDFB182|nr:HisA/HisF-related TIM barrel protein [Phyllobacterium myrsinacearum]